MNLIYVLLPVFCSLAICSGNILPAGLGASESDTANSQARRGMIDFLNNEIEARCNPGLWCRKRGTTEQSPITTEQNTLVPEEEPLMPEYKPLSNQRNREFVCLPGTICRKRSRIVTGKTEGPMRRTRAHSEGKQSTV